MSNEVTVTTRKSSADAATQKQRSEKQSKRLGPGWSSARKAHFWPEMPDRVLMPDDVLADYDAAAALIEYGETQEARLKAIPAEVEKLRAEHDKHVDAAIKQKKTPPAPPSKQIAELEAEAEAIAASIGKIRSQAWAKRTSFAKSSVNKMSKTLPKAVTDLESATSEIEKLMSKLDAEIDRAHNAQGRIRFADTFRESPRFPVGNILDKPSAELHDALQHLRLYAAKSRERL